MKKMKKYFKHFVAAMFGIGFTYLVFLPKMVAEFENADSMGWYWAFMGLVIAFDLGVIAGIIYTAKVEE